MKKTFFLLLLGLFTMAYAATGQSPHTLKFNQGQELQVTMDIKTSIVQQAMGQAIDFLIDAKGVHSFTVTNVTDDNTTLHHKVDRILFSFDGWGQKLKFDSDVEKDLNGRFGKPVKELLSKSYDMIIDPQGKALVVMPEKIELSKAANGMELVNSLLKEVLDIVQPPQKGNNSFFGILPAKEPVQGDTWNEQVNSETGITQTTYTIDEITDSAIIVAFTGTALSVTKAEMMGNETTTRMTIKSTGKIVIDKLTGIIREKTTEALGTGNTESAFGELPLTSKSSITIKVADKKQ